MQSLRVIDSHTGGEPTRVVLGGQIELQGATMAERRDDLDRRFAHLRHAIVNEPRGADVLVGAVLTPPVTPGAVCGIVFFTTVGTLGMCGHGTIGVVETLFHLGRVEPGPIVFDTPVGPITAILELSGEVVLTNVESDRYLAGVTVTVAGANGLTTVTGDVAFGGNWFFIVHEPTFSISLANRDELTRISMAIRRALADAGITGRDGAEIDHIELFGDGPVEGADSINFVLCPGGTYDRSPCGTGTSAKLAALYAAGSLAPGETYHQMSVTGSVFRASIQPTERGVIPTIFGRAFVTAESTLLFEEDDPIRWGLGAP